jgi:hypothetical protein
VNVAAMRRRNVKMDYTAFIHRRKQYTFQNSISVAAIVFSRLSDDYFYFQHIPEEKCVKSVSVKLLDEFHP